MTSAADIPSGGDRFNQRFDRRLSELLEQQASTRVVQAVGQIVHSAVEGLDRVEYRDGQVRLRRHGRQRPLHDDLNKVGPTGRPDLVERLVDLDDEVSDQAPGGLDGLAGVVGHVASSRCAEGAATPADDTVEDPADTGGNAPAGQAAPLRLARQVAAIRALHHPVDITDDPRVRGPFCAECSSDLDDEPDQRSYAFHPCPTVEALDRA